MVEREVEDFFCDCVRERGGEVRKVKWIGRRHAPDRLAMLPSTEKHRHPGRNVFVELKRPGFDARAGQLREHVRMRRAGMDVRVLDSIGAIREFFNNHDRGLWNL